MAIRDICIEHVERIRTQCLHGHVGYKVGGPTRGLSEENVKCPFRRASITSVPSPPT
jgi:hypothetical protein